ncbi:MAG: tRNA lysidine(34) synthetase TilS [Clostridia bacterium]|nr:tRNA lysidine(34) synthetase TilS [Clostridia bacterium]
MENVIEYIKEHKMIKSGEIIGVACSGGRDSISLLHYLNSIKAELDCEVVAINVDHGIRQLSALDTEFVMQFCKDHKIRAYKFKGEALKVAKEEKLTVEQAARKVRYGIFETVVQKGVCDKIALAHHMYDQAETVLLNILRGAGLNGARGMEPVRDGIYIRPLLATPRENIMAYIDEFGLEYVDDETNKDTTYSRNYLRNIVMPALRRHFHGADRSLVNFAELCAKDDNFINSKIDTNTMIETKEYVKVPLSYFYQDEALVNRILKKVFDKFSRQDFERRHIDIVRSFAVEAENGNMITLPFKVKALKEYDYIVIGYIKKKENIGEYPFQSGKLKIEGYGIIRSTSSKVLTEPKIHQHIIDAEKLPSNAVWRFRQEGDTFAPLGLGGTKKLKEYFIDKKVPQRMRNEIPVLAVGNKILAVADIEIADEIKVTNETKRFYKINYEKDLM